MEITSAKSEIRQIEGLLREAAYYDWHLTPVGKQNESGWCYVRKDQTLFVNMNKHWLYFTLPVSKLSKIDSDILASFLNHCRRFFMCKYCLDNDNMLLLQSELPMIRLDRAYFLKAVESLTYYADTGMVSEIRGGDQVHRIGETEIKTPTSEKDEVEVFSEEMLKSFFQAVEHRGWGLRDQRGKNHWYCGYKTQDRSFDVYISFDRSWTYFQIPMLNEPLAIRQKDNAFPGILYRYLLELNEFTYWAKFGLDEEGQILLMLDIPLEVFDLKCFRWAIRTLETYASEYFYDIQIIAGLDSDKLLADILHKRSES